MPVENKKLAKDISDRLDEIMSITGLNLIGLAVFCKVKSSYLKSVWYGNSPISVEWVKRICDAFNIDLVQFFSFTEPFDDELSNAPSFVNFKKRYIGKGLGYFTEEGEKQKPASQTRKYEREKIAYIIQYTDYLAEKRTTESMVKDFASDYGLILKSGRIYQLLAPYVDKQLEKRKTTKRTLKGEESKKEVFEYIKKPSV